MSVFVNNPRLLSEFRAGHPAALETVYWAYVDVVGQVARRGALLAGGGAASGAGDDWTDLVQDTFESAFAERARLGYDGIRPYRPYLLTICRNLLADWLRKRGRELPTGALDEDQAALAVDAPDEAWADPAVMAIVDAYLLGLDPKLAGVYRERYQRGLSQEEAAAALGLSRQRVRTLEDKLRRGLAKALRR
jgi:RNA polymerase sigma factor (sigma-70 family)